MFLNGWKVVLIFFQKGVIEGVAEVAVTAVCEFGKTGEGFDLGYVIRLRGNEGNEGSQEVGDGNNPISLVGADGASFSAGVHGRSNGGDIFKTGQKEGLDNYRCAGSSANSYDSGGFRHMIFSIFCHWGHYTRKRKSLA